MAKSTRSVDPELLPHPRPCWCGECKRTYNRLYMRDYKPVRSSKCAACGVEFDLPCPSGKPPKFCSDECRTRARDDARPDRLCVVCGAPFKAKGRRTRCDEHFVGGHKRAVRVVVNCPWCFHDFEATEKVAARNPCCSAGCTKARSKNWERYKAANLCYRPLCIECGDPTLKAPGKSKWCKSCMARRSMHYATDSGRDAKRLANRRRRESTQSGETFSVHDLIERDGDCCYICGERVRFDVDPQAGLLYPTIDHRVPLAAGGEHTMANAALACRRCNCVKGARDLNESPAV